MMAENAPAGLTPELLAEISAGLRDESAKKREATIRRYSQLTERDDRVGSQLKDLALSDPVDYVRAVARAALTAKPLADAAFVVPTAISPELRRSILDKEIQKYVRDGFRVQTQTDTTAQLVKPKRLSCLLAVILLLLMVLPFLIYLIWYASQKDAQVYLEVDAEGKVTATRRKG